MKGFYSIFGLPSYFKLLEPIHCFKCDSSPYEDVGTYEEHSTAALGGKNLKVIRIHDGKGGIKNFHTSGVEPKNPLSQEPWRFPGYFQRENHQGREISLVEECNACGERWSGTLHVQPFLPDDIYVTEALDINADGLVDAGDLKLKVAFAQSRSQINTFEEYDGQRIRIVPDLEAAVLVYRQEAEELRAKAQHARGLLRGINCPYVPVAKIEEYLERLVDVDGKRYENDLARAVADYDAGEKVNRHAENALSAALFILFNHDLATTRQILESSGMDTQSFFIFLNASSWFFKPKSRRTGQDDFASLAGILGGPNMFLHHLDNQK